jgi:hypothetical protein
MPSATPTTPAPTIDETGCNSATAGGDGSLVFSATPGATLLTDTTDCTDTFSTSTGTWIILEATADGEMGIKCTAGNKKVGAFSIFSGTCGERICVASADCSAGGDNKFKFEMTEGTVYLIYYD